MTVQSKHVAAGQPGDLDLKFGKNGIVETLPGSQTIRSLVEDELGAIVYIAWASSGECWLCRVFSDGSPDLQFGVNGVTKWAFAPGLESMALQLIRQADGKFLLIGGVRTEIPRSRAAITRFNKNGSADLIFGNKIFPFPTEGNFVTGLPTGCLQEDGKVLLAADYTMLAGSVAVDSAIVLRCLQANGEDDLGFGGRGFIEVRFKGQNSKCDSVAVLPDGRILVGGTTSQPFEGLVRSRMSIACFFPNGALDQTFGDFGYWQAEAQTNMGKLIVHENSIICAGRISGPTGVDAVIYRLTADGMFDPTFNNGEPLLVDIPADMPRIVANPYTIAVQSDGKILVGGTASIHPKYAFWLRIQSNGVLDPTFGHQGISSRFLAGNVWELIVQGDSQRIIAAFDPESTADPQILGILS